MRRAARGLEPEIAYLTDLVRAFGAINTDTRRPRPRKVSVIGKTGVRSKVKTSAKRR